MGKAGRSWALLGWVGEGLCAQQPSPTRLSEQLRWGAGDVHPSLCPFASSEGGRRVLGPDPKGLMDPAKSSR